MKGRTFLKAAVVIGALAGFVAAQAANLVPDPGFKKANFTPPSKNTTWRKYQISAPSAGQVDAARGAVTLKGGKTFLHSSAFDVTPGRKYNVSLKAAGKGKVSVEFLWWTRYSDDSIEMADPHRTIPIKPTAVGDAAKTLTGNATAPKGAKRAYIRIVVEGGAVTISDPAVQ